MHCPYCSHPHSKVTDSRVVENAIRRRRECQRCERRFTTYERVQATPLMVCKQDGRREEFNREKLLSGIRKACAKRPVSSRTIEGIAQDIESQLQHQGNAEVPSSLLGGLVMDRLKELDRVAYIRYSSVYRDFQDIESFEKAVRDLKESSPQLPLLDMPPAPAKKTRRRAAPAGANRRRTGANRFKDDANGSRPKEPPTEILGDLSHEE